MIIADEIQEPPGALGRGLDLRARLGHADQALALGLAFLQLHAELADLGGPPGKQQRVESRGCPAPSSPVGGEVRERNQERRREVHEAEPWSGR